MPLIEIVDLCQRYNERDILKNINIRIDRGEFFALIGPTGSGKTTLLRLIGLLDSPTDGRIYFDGTDVTESGRMPDFAVATGSDKPRQVLRVKGDRVGTRNSQSCASSLRNLEATTDVKTEISLRNGFLAVRHICTDPNCNHAVFLNRSERKRPSSCRRLGEPEHFVIIGALPVLRDLVPKSLH